MQSLAMLIGLDWNPGRKKTGRTALSFLGGVIIASAVLAFKGRPQWRWIAAIGIPAALTAYAWHSAQIWIYRLLNGLACSAAFIATTVFLAVAYYAFISPFAIVLRLFRAGPLNLKPSRARSFWIEIPQSKNDDEKNQCERLY